MRLVLVFLGVLAIARTGAADLRPDPVTCRLDCMDEHVTCRRTCVGLAGSLSGDCELACSRLTLQCIGRCDARFK